jgi:hypothetical protein
LNSRIDLLLRLVILSRPIQNVTKCNGIGQNVRKGKEM